MRLTLIAIALLATQANAANFYVELGAYHYLTSSDEKVLESLASAMAIQKQRYWLTFSLKAARWAERLTISAHALLVQTVTHG